MQHLRKCPGLAAAAVAAVLAGCDAAPPIYRHTTGGPAGADLSPRSQWTAGGGLTSPQDAIDGNLGTAARSDLAYDGAELTIDLKRPCLFAAVIIDHGNSPEGHCRSVGVATSLDGKEFTDWYSAPGTRRVTVLMLPRPVLARYLRLRAIRPGPKPWSIAEVYLQ